MMTVSPEATKVITNGIRKEITTPVGKNSCPAGGGHGPTIATLAWPDSPLRHIPGDDQAALTHQVQTQKAWAPFQGFSPPHFQKQTSNQSEPHLAHPGGQGVAGFKQPSVLPSAKTAKAMERKSPEAATAPAGLQAAA